MFYVCSFILQYTVADYIISGPIMLFSITTYYVVPAVVRVFDHEQMDVQYGHQAPSFACTCARICSSRPSTNSPIL